MTKRPIAMTDWSFKNGTDTIFPGASTIKIVSVPIFAKPREALL